MLFDGFLKVYEEGRDEPVEDEDESPPAPDRRGRAPPLRRGAPAALPAFAKARTDPKTRW
jgi:DNA topoisomerase-1